MCAILRMNQASGTMFREEGSGNHVLQGLWEDGFAKACEWRYELIVGDTFIVSCLPYLEEHPI